MWKLVRDKIPQIIGKSGKDPEYVSVSGSPLKFLLRDKLFEEATELQVAMGQLDIQEEICDCLEVLHSLAEIHGIEWNEVENQWLGKRSEKGGFQQGMLLKMPPKE